MRPHIPRRMVPTPSDNVLLGVGGAAATIGGGAMLSRSLGIGSWGPKTLGSTSWKFGLGGLVAVAGGVGLLALLRHRLGAGAAGPGNPGGTTPSKPRPGQPVATPSFHLAPVAAGLDSPDSVAFAPGDGRPYVAGQGGTIVRIEPDGTKTRVLDISGQVNAGGEEGLLGLAFHPGFATNGRAYAMWTGRDNNLRVGEFHVGADGRADGPPKVLLQLHDQKELQDGGQLAFGPDGQLYVAIGDGGSGAHGGNLAHDMTSLRGKVVKLDVDASGSATPTPTIVGSGLRNPWRFSFDSATGDLYIGDVGQGRREEIDRIAAGDTKVRDFGWSTQEGDIPFNKPSSAPPEGTLPAPAPGHEPVATRPIFAYPHVGNDQAVIGGFVYRGTAIPELRGWYLYGDIGSTSIGALQLGHDGTVLASKHVEVGVGGIDAFGEDAAGELYVTSFEGNLLRIDPGAARATPAAR